MQPKRGLPLGRPFGSSLLVSGSWFPAGALLSAHLAVSLYQTRPLPEAIGWGFASVGALFVVVLLHELAHIAVARIFGISTIDARVFVFGGLRTSTRGSAWAELLVALAGPFSTGVICAALLLAAGRTHGTLSDLASAGGLVALALAAVNLIPAAPLDGGQALAALRSWVTGDRLRAVRGTRRLGRVLGALLVLGGLALVGADPLAVQQATLGSWLALTGVFVLVRAGSQQQAPILRPQEPISEWARPFAGRLDADDALPLGGGPYAVADGGHLAGVLPSGASGSFSVATVSEAMVPWGPELGVGTDEPASWALERLARGETPVLVVLDARGVVRGVVDQGTVRRRLDEKERS